MKLPISWLNEFIDVSDIPVEELSTFEEVGQCGTAVVITPVKLIEDKTALAAETVTASYAYNDECGPKSRKLYETLTGIQYGEIEDKHGWCTIVEE